MFFVDEYIQGLPHSLLKIEYCVVTLEKHTKIKHLSFTKCLFGWSIEKTDTTGGNEKMCYWASINYLGNESNLKYRVKYCFNNKDINEVNNRIEFNIVGAFDFIEKTGGYKASDEGVLELLEVFEDNILNGIAPDC
ncbi:MAG: hypothetical protein OEW75_13345 [Cyclobacteriaceae bacterium]|nr:hypothetical protein [Cyclobacteriaceae bacterium]